MLLMKMIQFAPVLSILLLSWVFTGCNEYDLGPEPLPDDYEQAHSEWKQYRADVLTDTTGWLRLQDLIWLEEGENTFGSGTDADIQFPEGSIQEEAGTFILEDGEVRMTTRGGVDIRHKGEQVDELQMTGEEVEERIHARHGELTWFIDKRGEQRGVKVFSMNTPKADNFEGFPAYPLQEEWHHRARFVHHPEETHIEITNVLGEVENQYSPGKVEFRVDDQLFSLDTFEASGGLFIMFSDSTNRTVTYQAGRYMIVDFPDDDGFTTLDFNKAYNPPCAFNKFTTCQLPPQQNRLDLAIPAGEKRPVEWEGL